MGLPFEKVTSTELAILRQIWERGTATIREVTDALYPQGTDAQYATVQKLLDRLSAKGLVTRNRSAKAHLYSATLSREQFIESRIQGVADELCGGSVASLLTTLVKVKTLTARDRRFLRSLIQDLDRENSRAASKGKEKK